MLRFDAFMSALEKRRVAEISFGDIEEVCTSREGALSLLSHVAKIARPNDGVPTLLFALAHLATRPFLRGGLRARFRAEGAKMRLELVEDLGDGQRAPFWSGTLDAPLTELSGAVPHIRKSLHPLRLVRERADVMVFGVALRGRRASINPPAPSENPPPASASSQQLDVIPPAPAVPSDEVPPLEDEVDGGW